MPKLSSPVAVVGVIVFGTTASLLAKLIYSVTGVDSHGNSVPFTKPWFQVLTMFAGMSACIVLDLPRKKARRSDEGERAPLLREAQRTEREEGGGGIPWIITIPTLFDLFATACGTTGLLYVPVSVYQMLRGAQLVFTALLSIVFLRRRLSMLNVLGIALCVCGIVAVGLANVWDAKPGTGAARDTSFGIIVILIGQVLQASQVVLEEHLLQNLSMSSVRVVAWEGLFGVAHCLLWVFPLVFLFPGGDGGHLEDPFDAFYMLFHSVAILAVIFADMALMLLYNVCGMEVTNNLSAVARVIIETLRTLFVWVCDLILFYLISGGRLGEAWTGYSWLQAFGFALTVAGTMTYNYQSVRDDYERTRKAASAPVADLVHEALVGAGPEPGYKPTDEAATAKAASSLDEAEQGVVEKKKAVSHPLRVGEEEEEWEEEEEEELVGSYASSYIGSATHGSFMGGYSFPSAMRRRSGVSPTR